MGEDGPMSSLTSMCFLYRVIYRVLIFKNVVELHWEAVLFKSCV